jgi:hypothetical protein
MPIRTYCHTVALATASLWIISQRSQVMASSAMLLFASWNLSQRMYRQRKPLWSAVSFTLRFYLETFSVNQTSLIGFLNCFFWCPIGSDTTRTIICHWAQALTVKFLLSLQLRCHRIATCHDRRWRECQIRFRHLVLYSNSLLFHLCKWKSTNPKTLF